jgi:pimeloyl-ACP methyl ester carboxylesterase
MVTGAAGLIDWTETGSGDPVVFLHPLLTSARHWRKVAPLVAAEGFRCVLPDLPLGSHHRPMPPEADLSPPGLARLVRDFVTELDVGPVTLVGNDSGGALAQIVAAWWPEVVDRVVLTSCDAFDFFPPPLFRYLKWVAKVPGAATAVGQTMRVRALRFTPITFGWLAKHRIPHEVLDSYAAPFLADPRVRTDTIKVLRNLDGRHTTVAAERLRSFDKPLLIAWAAEDRVFPPALARRLAATVPRAELRWISDSYAFTAEDQPEALARLIVEFCRGSQGV